MNHLSVLSPTEVWLKQSALDSTELEFVPRSPTRSVTSPMTAPIVRSSVADISTDNSSNATGGSTSSSMRSAKKPTSARQRGQLQAIFDAFLRTAHGHRRFDAEEVPHVADIKRSQIALIERQMVESHRWKLEAMRARVEQYYQEGMMCRLLEEQGIMPLPHNLSAIVPPPYDHSTLMALQYTAPTLACQSVPLGSEFVRERTVARTPSPQEARPDPQEDMPCETVLTRVRARKLNMAGNAILPRRHVEPVPNESQDLGRAHPSVSSQATLVEPSQSSWSPWGPGDESLEQLMHHAVRKLRKDRSEAVPPPHSEAEPLVGLMQQAVNRLEEEGLPQDQFCNGSDALSDAPTMSESDASMRRETERWIEQLEPPPEPAEYCSQNHMHQPLPQASRHQARLPAQSLASPPLMPPTQLTLRPPPHTLVSRSPPRQAPPDRPRQVRSPPPQAPPLRPRTLRPPYQPPRPLARPLAQPYDGCSALQDIPQARRVAPASRGGTPDDLCWNARHRENYARAGDARIRSAGQSELRIYTAQDFRIRNEDFLRRTSDAQPRHTEDAWAGGADRRRLDSRRNEREERWRSDMRADWRRTEDVRNDRKEDSWTQTDQKEGWGEAPEVKRYDGPRIEHGTVSELRSVLYAGQDKKDVCPVSLYMDQKSFEEEWNCITEEERAETRRLEVRMRARDLESRGPGRIPWRSWSAGKHELDNACRGMQEIIEPSQPSTLKLLGPKTHLPPPSRIFPRPPVALKKWEGSGIRRHRLVTLLARSKKNLKRGYYEKLVNRDALFYPLCFMELSDSRRSPAQEWNACRVLAELPLSPSVTNLHLNVRVMAKYMGMSHVRARGSKTAAYLDVKGSQRKPFRLRNIPRHITTVGIANSATQIFAEAYLQKTIEIATLERLVVPTINIMSVSDHCVLIRCSSLTGTRLEVTVTQVSSKEVSKVQVYVKGKTSLEWWASGFTPGELYVACCRVSDESEKKWTKESLHRRFRMQGENEQSLKIYDANSGIDPTSMDLSGKNVNCMCLPDTAESNTAKEDTITFHGDFIFGETKSAPTQTVTSVNKIHGVVCELNSPSHKLHGNKLAMPIVVADLDCGDKFDEGVHSSDSCRSGWEGLQIGSSYADDDNVETVELTYCLVDSIQTRCHCGYDCIFLYINNLPHKCYLDVKIEKEGAWHPVMMQFLEGTPSQTVFVNQLQQGTSYAVYIGVRVPLEPVSLLPCYLH